MLSDRDSLSNKGTGASRSSVRAEGGVQEEAKQDTTGKGGRDLLNEI